MCDQQRLRPACAYALSDQSLCWSLEYFMTVKLLIKHNLEFLSLKGGCTGSSESIHVKMPHCWKSHVTQTQMGYIMIFTNVKLAAGCRLPIQSATGNKKAVVDCLTRDRGVPGSSLTGVTALWSLSKTHLS